MDAGRSNSSRGSSSTGSREELAVQLGPAMREELAAQLGPMRAEMSELRAQVAAQARRLEE
eukprot:10550485-Prorocentrum_lima.AAC.1